MCNGNGAPGISTTFSGKRGMSDKSVLLPLFDRILSHLAPALLDTPLRRLMPPVGGWGELASISAGQHFSWSVGAEVGPDHRKPTLPPRRFFPRRERRC